MPATHFGGSGLDRGRTSVREVWVSSYTKDGNAIVRNQHRITMTNRGACAIDDRPVRDEEGRKLIASIMESIFKGRK